MNIVLADDHKLVRDGLLPFLNELHDTVHIQEAGTFDELLQAAEVFDTIDLILTDLDMPGMKGMDSFHAIVKTHSAVPVVILSGTSDIDFIRQALDIGVAGFIPKSSGSKVLLSALQLILSGEKYVPADFLDAPFPVATAPTTTNAVMADVPPGHNNVIVDIIRFKTLSPRELGVFNLLAGGLTNKEIAQAIDVKEATIKIHVKNIYRKIGASNRAQAVRMALQPDWEV